VTSPCIGPEFAVGSSNELKLHGLRQAVPWPYACDMPTNNWVRRDVDSGLWVPPRTAITIAEDISGSPNSSAPVGTNVYVSLPTLTLTNPDTAAVMTVVAFWFVRVWTALASTGGTHLLCDITINGTLPGTPTNRMSQPPVGSFNWRSQYTAVLHDTVPAGQTKTIQRRLGISPFNVNATLTSWDATLFGFGMTLDQN
jgi:hypothetical protein